MTRYTAKTAEQHAANAQAQANAFAKKTVALQSRDPQIRAAARLAELLGITQAQAADMGLDNRYAIRSKIEAALKIERIRGESGQIFPGYDRNREINLTAALVDETVNIVALQNIMIARMEREIKELTDQVSRQEIELVLREQPRRAA